MPPSFGNENMLRRFVAVFPPSLNAQLARIVPFFPTGPEAGCRRETVFGGIWPPERNLAATDMQ